MGLWEIHIRGLNVDRCSWLHIDYLRSTSFEEHSFRVIKLPSVTYVMVLVANDLKAELSVKRICTRSFSSYIIPIQEYLVASHPLGYDCSCRITCSRNLS